MKVLDYNKLYEGQKVLINYEGEATEATILEIGRTYTKVNIAEIGDRKVILEDVLIEIF